MSRSLISSISGARLLSRSDKKEETKTEENSAQNGQGDSGLNGHGSDHVSEHTLAVQNYQFAVAV